MREKVLRFLLDHGTLAEPEAVNFILSQKDPLAYVRRFMDGRAGLPLVLSMDDFRAAQSILEFQDPNPALPRPTEKPGAQSHLPDPGEGQEGDKQGSAKPGDEFHIITDVTGASTCDGSVENFTEFFRDRFRIIRRIIKSHAEMGAPMKISMAKFADRESKIIGMVMDASKTKNGHIGLTLEDDTGEIFALIHKDSVLINEVILKDEVIGLVGKISSGGRGRGGHQGKGEMFIPSEIHRPSIPAARTQRRSSKDIEVAFISDIHTGSSHFLSNAWSGFTDWICSQEAKGIGYLVVAGDLVDGIGIYPNQEDELSIMDIHKQYDELARLLSPIPEGIRVILQPGNHDAVRPSEPQPALHEKFRGQFGRNISFVGNPCHFSIGGVEILAYHGRSIDDLVSSIPGVNYRDPVPPMLEMLKRRLLAVSYGGKVPLAPESKDYMVINPVPDILVTGHVHRAAVHRVSGMTLINASAWQSQTPFQKMHNFHPDPGKVMVSNLRTGRCRIRDFAEN